MWDKIREYGFVTIIALLVWLYAEGENVTNAERDIEVEFVPASNNLVVDDTESEDERVSVLFRGNSGQLNDLKELLHEGAIQIEMNAGEEARQQVTLRDRLADHPKIVEVGVSVLETRPETLNVTVERLVKLDIPVTVVATGETQLRDVTVTPEKVSVRLPASTAEALGESPRAEARVTEALIEGLPVNQQHSLAGVAIVLPDLTTTSNVTLTPAAADVTCTIKKLAKDLLLPAVSVRIVAPVAELARYDVQPASEEDQLVRDIKISGPNDLIDQIESRQVKVWADLQLQSEDLAQAVAKESVSIVPHIHLPAGVTLVEPPRPIKVRVLEKKAEEPNL